MTTDETESDHFEGAYKGLVKKLMAKHPKCQNIATVFAVGNGQEIVYLRHGAEAKAEIAEIQARGGEAIGGYVYGGGEAAPFAIDTLPTCPNFAFVERLARRIAEEIAGQN